MEVIGVVTGRAATRAAARGIRASVGALGRDVIEAPVLADGRIDNDSGENRQGNGGLERLYARPDAPSGGVCRPALSMGKFMLCDLKEVRLNQGTRTTPLVSHGGCNSSERARALFPAILTGRHPMDPGFAASDDIGRPESGQVLQPKACRLRLAVAVLPWLNDLIRRTDMGPDNRNRVLYGNPRYWCEQKHADESKGVGLFFAFLGEPASATDGQVGAWRMCNHQIKSPVYDVAHVALVMRAGPFAWQQIAGNCVMSDGQECISNDAGIFACN